MNRRAHYRVPSAQLPEPARVRIRNKPAISLVDLSPGGALLELPFQMQPQAQVTVEILTPGTQVAVPFQLLRCYVADLNGGVRYHAAGFFEQTLKLPSVLSERLMPPRAHALLETLEAFLRTNERAPSSPRGARFNDLLSWVVAVLRRGEPSDEISMQVKARLSQMFPSLAIMPASSSALRDTETCARFFDLEFRSNSLLTASDRRFLRASAQLVTLLQRDAEREVSLNDQLAGLTEDDVPSELIVRGIGEWETVRRTHGTLSR